jgi:hypothetical protein
VTTNGLGIESFESYCGACEHIAELYRGSGASLVFVSLMAALYLLCLLLLGVFKPAERIPSLTANRLNQYPYLCEHR